MSPARGRPLPGRRGGGRGRAMDEGQGRPARNRDAREKRPQPRVAAGQPSSARGWGSGRATPPRAPSSYPPPSPPIPTLSEKPDAAPGKSSTRPPQGAPARLSCAPHAPPLQPPRRKGREVGGGGGGIGRGAAVGRGSAPQKTDTPSTRRRRRHWPCARRRHGTMAAAMPGGRPLSRPPFPRPLPSGQAARRGCALRGTSRTAPPRSPTSLHRRFPAPTPLLPPGWAVPPAAQPWCHVPGSSTATTTLFKATGRGGSAHGHGGGLRTRRPRPRRRALARHWARPYGAAAITPHNGAHGPRRRRANDCLPVVDNRAHRQATVLWPYALHIIVTHSHR